MKEARRLLNWDDLNDVIEDLFSKCEKNELSPFCIEYELYAQFMFKFYADKIRFTKWANIAQVRTDVNQKPIRNEMYSSISFHDYLVS
jgi:hypothetical protein